MTESQSSKPVRTYKMFPEHKFAVVYFAPGDLHVEDALEVNKQYKNDEFYSHIHYLVLVFSGCNPIFKEADLEFISEQYSYNPQTNNHKRSVFIVDQPKSTAFAHLIMANTPEDSTYCTTLEQAYDFLRPKELSFSDFLAKIQELID